MSREGVDVAGLDELLEDARKLLAYDAERFQRVHALIKAYVSIYENPDEPIELFAELLARATGRRDKGFS